MTLGTSFTKLMAPVTWYRTLTLRTCVERHRHEVRRLSRDHEDGVDATRSSSSFMKTLSRRLLPGHGQVLEELVDGVRDVLERAEINPFIRLKLLGTHIPMILDNFPDVFRLRGTCTIAKPSPCTHEARRLSCDHEDAIDATWHRDRRDHVTFKFIFHAESAPPAQTTSILS